MSSSRQADPQSIVEFIPGWKLIEMMDTTHHFWYVCSEVMFKACKNPDDVSKYSRYCVLKPSWYFWNGRYTVYTKPGADPRLSWMRIHDENVTKEDGLNLVKTLIELGHPHATDHD